jgi:hypothetical protein
MVQLAHPPARRRGTDTRVRRRQVGVKIYRSVVLERSARWIHIHGEDILVMYQALQGRACQRSLP